MQYWQSFGFRALLAMAMFATDAFLPAHALNPERQISQYAHSAWRIADGFFQGTPTTITQTTDGYIYIGTVSGILRYDGDRFESWTPTGENLSNGSITRMLGTTDGSLWIGTVGNGLFSWKDRTLARYLSDIATPVLEDRSGAVWVSRNSSPNRLGTICDFRKNHFNCHGSEEGIPSPPISIAQDASGAIWIASFKDIVKWRAGAIEERLTLPNVSLGRGDSIIDIVCTGDGTLWIGVKHAGPGLGLQHRVGGILTSLKTAHWDSSNVSVSRLLIDRNNNVWVATANQGLYRIDQDQHVDHFGSLEGLTGDFVTNLFEDHEGNVWVTSTKGVDVFRDLAVATFSKHEGLGADEVDAVAALRNGEVWVGGGDALDALREGQFTPVRTGIALRPKQITSLFEDDQGGLWIGSDDKMSVFKNDRLIEVKRPLNLRMGYVVGMTQDVNRDFWFEVYGPPRELLHVHALKVDAILTPPQLPLARKIASDPKGGLWLGLMTGDLARFRDGKLDLFPYPHKTESTVNEVRVDGDGTVYGATAFGLIGWRDGLQQVLTTSNGLPCNEINTFIKDKTNTLWLYTQCGLVSIAADEVEQWWRHSNRRLTMRVYDSSDGVQPGLASFQGAAQSVDGKLWFANGFVLQTISPEHVPRNIIVPPVHIQEITADRLTLGSNEITQLPALTRNVAIHYSALSFVAPQKVLFRYKLEGQDLSWQEAGTRRDAFYTNLGPGDYRFRVIACNNDGVWNESGDAVEFTILPAYFQTRWFTALCVLTLATVLLLFYVLRLRQARRDIEQRLGARLEERERISRDLHDTLLQGFQGLVLRFQSVMKIIPKDSPSHRLMEEVLDRADQVLLEGRQSVRGLRAESLPADELSNALERCGKELTISRAVTFEPETVGTPVALSPVYFDEVYKIAREALCNAFQHAHATIIKLSLMYSSKGLTVTISDNGAGIEPEVLSKGRLGHWGLPGMRERAHKIGARLKIQSALGSGTEVELVIPAQHLSAGRRKRPLWRRFMTNIPEEG